MTRRGVVTILLGLGAPLSWFASTHGATLRVPQDYPDITSAANAAQPGDSILVWRNPDGSDWENQQISLRQGVLLRGMEDFHPFAYMVLRNCAISLQEEPPSPNDTTRVEHLKIHNPPYMEAVQVYTPRSSIVDCAFTTTGPQGYAIVRVWKGGLISRNYFAGSETSGIEARQGTILITWNLFYSMFTSFALYNETAPEIASLFFRNNTVLSNGELYVYSRPDSYAELVNNIFSQGGPRVFCSGPVDIRYNDFYQATSYCPLGVGNIFDDPQLCAINSKLVGVEPDSPCVGSGENGATMGAGGICGVTSVGGQDSPSPQLLFTVTPNPVWSDAEFSFGRGVVAPTLEIYDPQGRLIDLFSPPGQRFRWSPAGTAPRGVYFARLRGAGVSETVKFVVIR